jgi:PIN domain nuclease of toxin-antitoxin system
LKLLLDTHIWLWSVLEPERLGKRLRVVLASPEHELRLSVVSIWEALLLHKKKKVYLSSDPVQWVRLASRSSQEVPLTQDIVIAAHDLELHGDPADRFLAATAMVLDLTLVTADARLLGLGNIATLANR